MCPPLTEQDMVHLRKVCDFDRLEKLIRSDFLTMIEKIDKLEEGHKDVFAIGCWLDCPQYCIGFFFSEEASFQKHLARKLKESPDYYSENKDIVRLRFFDYSTEYYYPSKALSKLLGEMNEITYEYYHKYGDAFSEEVESEYEDKLKDIVAHIINKLKPETNKLFIGKPPCSYITLYDESYKNEYDTLRLTLSESFASTMMLICESNA